MRMLAWTTLLTGAITMLACGARTGLDEPPGPVADAGPPADARLDAPADVVDAAFDAPPPVCDDAGVTYIYVVTEQNGLWSYYPPANSFTFIGDISCPAAIGSTPYSMAVDRGGTAYVLFDDGELFKVSTADASCSATSFVVGQHGFDTFGMGFSSDTDDPGETLFVAEADFTGPSQGLASIDTQTLALSFIGPFSQPLGRMELTGTGDGRLFGFSLDNPGPGSHLSQFDKATAAVLSSIPLAVGAVDDGFAYAFWGGSFYIFTGPGGPSTVTLYDPATQSLQTIGSHPETIVGAGVSTCAPH